MDHRVTIDLDAVKSVITLDASKLIQAAVRQKLGYHYGVDLYDDEPNINDKKVVCSAIVFLKNGDVVESQTKGAIDTINFSVMVKQDPDFDWFTEKLFESLGCDNIKRIIIKPFIVERAPKMESKTQSATIESDIDERE